MRSMHCNFISLSFLRMLSIVLCIFLNTVINAKEDVNQSISQTDIVYDAAYFDNYQPVTLNDMIRLVPGGLNILTNLNQNQQSRGLGSTGDQILLDGKRMSGKANDMSARLSRIQASQVERIELIRSTTEGFDVRSQGNILNVILKSESSSDYYIELLTQYNDEMNIIPEGLFTKNGSLENLDYTVGYHYDTWHRYQDEFEDRAEQDPANRQFRYLDKEFEIRRHTFTANTNYNLSSGDVIQLNAYYRDQRRLTDNIETQVKAESDELLAIEDQRLDYNDTHWEFGSDYETNLANLGNLKALMILSRTANQYGIAQNETVNGFSERLFTFVEDAVKTERIIRINLSQNYFTNHTVEIGGEVAFNQLLANQSFDLADFEKSDVSEARNELFTTYSVPFSNAFTLQLALNRESSTIEQSSLGLESERDFTFWKPRIELRYDLDDNNQFRFVSERTASQLNLRNFIARRNTEDDTIDLGNPFLQPEKIQQLLLGYEHRFGDETGSIKFDIFRDNVKDHISQAPLVNGGTGTGNIGDAVRTGFNFESNMKLISLGLNEALLSFKYEYRDTEATDPFRGGKRPLNSEPMHYYYLDFRHDLPQLDLVYGFNAHKRSSMYRSNITLYEVRRNDTHISEIFAEYSIAEGMRLRAQISNPLNDKKYYDKTFYVDNIADDIIDRVEQRATDVRPTFTLKFQAIF